MTDKVQYTSARRKSWRLRRRRYPNSFDARLESAQRGLHFIAQIQYSFRVRSDADPPLQHPDAVARSLLCDTVDSTVRKYHVADLNAAESAANRKLSMPLEEGSRIRVEGEISLFVPPETKRLADEIEALEAQLRLEQHRDTMRLQLLRERLTDPGLGLVWWIDRYADLQFTIGEPEAKVKSVIKAYKVIREHLNEAEIVAETGDRAYVRRRVDEIFESLKEPDSLEMTLEIVNRVLRSIGHETLPSAPSASQQPGDYGFGGSD